MAPFYGLAVVNVDYADFKNNLEGCYQTEFPIKCSFMAPPRVTYEP